jgi:aspartyl-tRNA(Asn)/glutamyl-tRNA(Gln) amidotransferase subunit B
VDEVVAAHPTRRRSTAGGKTKLLGFFTGQVMKAMKGKG